MLYTSLTVTRGRDMSVVLVSKDTNGSLMLLKEKPIRGFMREAGILGDAHCQDRKGTVTWSESWDDTYWEFTKMCRKEWNLLYA